MARYAPRFWHFFYHRLEDGALGSLHVVDISAKTRILGQPGMSAGCGKPVADWRCTGAESTDHVARMQMMASKPRKKHPGRRGDPVSLHPLTMDQAVDAIFAIKPDDVRKILAKRPGKGKKK